MCQRFYSLLKRFFFGFLELRYLTVGFCLHFFAVYFIQFDFVFDRFWGVFSYKSYIVLPGNQQCISR